MAPTVRCYAKDTREHERIFAPARLHFGATKTSIAFDASVLDLPVFNANATLFPFFEQHANALLVSCANLAELSA
ncbi:hypothetical protein [Hymenobacter cavernae]|uniref:Uncharacterized protein n=1 Tax=Hymenobacter cavernae TaxID=2044852 RepID=A0ABQ1UCM5_9BACT|nr:hypothetical protein [Hymenobacter cavernae]GGF15964.1 hypothetical protein GCM10011383_29140 [Hymenobacter cavernae]